MTRLPRIRSVSLAAIAVISHVACSPPDESASARTKADTTASAAAPIPTPLPAGPCSGYRECLRAAEAPALAAQQHVRRDSLRLVITVASGAPITFEDGPPEHEARDYYLYNGWDSTLNAHRVYAMSYESSGVLFVFPSSGVVSSVDDLPVVSPSSRFAATASWDTEAFHEPNRVRIYRISADSLAIVWELEPTLWGPESIRWINDSTLSIERGAAYRHPDPAQLKAPVLVSFTRNQWRADSSARAP